MSPRDHDVTHDLTVVKNGIQRLKDREDVQRTALRPIQFGATRCITVLQQQILALVALETELERLQSAGAGYDVQIAELQQSKSEILAIQREAEAIRKGVTGADSTLLTRDHAAKVWQGSIVPLRIKEVDRRRRALRIQGTMVTSESFTGTKCGGLLGEATVLAAQHLLKAATDANEMRNMWRRFTLEGSKPVFWLYRHSPDKKWHCQFFRIEISRMNDNLDFLFEAYVPFGLRGDPGRYAITESKVYTRDGWHSQSVYSQSYNRSNTYSVNTSVTRTEGRSLGVTEGTSESVQTGNSTSYSLNESFAKTMSETSSYSWFNSSGTGNSYTDGGFSSSTNASEGESNSISKTVGDTATTSIGVTFGDNRSETIGTNRTKTLTDSDSTADTIGVGQSMTGGEGLTIERYHYGIDYSLPSKEHLAKWREANYDAARDFDAVTRWFKSVCADVTQQIQAIVKTGKYPEGKEVKPRLGELANLLLIEPPLASLSDIKAIEHQ